MTISPVSDPTLDDFYPLAGSDIPADAILEFTTPARVRPTPHRRRSSGRVTGFAAG